MLCVYVMFGILRARIRICSNSILVPGFGVSDHPHEDPVLIVSS